MSEPIPESIPTSISRPSQRPTKKLRSSNNTSTDQQAAQISTLMSNPDVPINIPDPSSSRTKHSYIPPEIVANVQGSSAGAGSGEFHVYKASRRREYARIQSMEEESKKEEANKKWEDERDERMTRDERERERNRAKRMKKKERQGKGKVKGKTGAMEVDKTSVNVDSGAEEVENGPRSKGRILPRPPAQNGVSSDDEGGQNGNGSVGPVHEENGVVIHDDD